MSLNTDSLFKWADRNKIPDHVLDLIQGAAYKDPSLAPKIDSLVAKDAQLKEVLRALAGIPNSSESTPSTPIDQKPSTPEQKPGLDERQPIRIPPMVAQKPAEPQTPQEKPPVSSAAPFPGLSGILGDKSGSQPQKQEVPAKKTGWGPLSVFRKPASGVPANGSRPNGIGPLLRPGAKKKNNLPLIIGGVVILILLVVGGLYLFGGFGSGESGPSDWESQSQPVETITVPPAEREAWAASQSAFLLDNSFNKKPENAVDFFQNIPWNWLLQFMGVWILFTLIARERTMAREFSDIKLSLYGVIGMLLAIIVAPMLNDWAIKAGILTGGEFITYLILIVGFLIGMVFQWGAYTTGDKDASVIAFGIFAWGLLLKWWFPGHALLPVIGNISEILGIVVLIFEIKREGSVAASIIGTVLMILVFSFGFVAINTLIDTYIASIGISADPTVSAGTALKILILSKSEMFVSVAIGMAIAYLIGILYGAVFLKPKRQNRGIVNQEGPLAGLTFLDSDSQIMFVMILWVALPWIWLLPKIYTTLFG